MLISIGSYAKGYRGAGVPTPYPMLPMQINIGSYAKGSQGTQGARVREAGIPLAPFCIGPYVDLHR